MTSDTIRKRKSSVYQSDDAKAIDNRANAQEKLLVSVEQLSQVLEILDKLVKRIKHQVEVMPTASKEDNNNFPTMDHSTAKKGSLLH